VALHENYPALPLALATRLSARFFGANRDESARSLRAQLSSRYCYQRSDALASLTLLDIKITGYVVAFRRPIGASLRRRWMTQVAVVGERERSRGMNSTRLTET